MFIFECRVSGSGIFGSGGGWALSVLLVVWWNYENEYNSKCISTIFGLEQDILVRGGFFAGGYLRGWSTTR